MLRKKSLHPEFLRLKDGFGLSGCSFPLAQSAINSLKLLKVLQLEKRGRTRRTQGDVVLQDEKSFINIIQCFNGKTRKNSSIYKIKISKRQSVGSVELIIGVFCILKFELHQTPPTKGKTRPFRYGFLGQSSTNTMKQEDNIL